MRYLLLWEKFPWQKPTKVNRWRPEMKVESCSPGRGGGSTPGATGAAARGEWDGKTLAAGMTLDPECGKCFALLWSFVNEHHTLVNYDKLFLFRPAYRIKIFVLASTTKRPAPAFVVVGRCIIQVTNNGVIYQTHRQKITGGFSDEA